MQAIYGIHRLFQGAKPLVIQFLNDFTSSGTTLGLNGPNTRKISMKNVLVEAVAINRDGQEWVESNIYASQCDISFINTSNINPEPNEG